MFSVLYFRRGFKHPRLKDSLNKSVKDEFKPLVDASFSKKCREIFSNQYFLIFISLISAVALIFCSYYFPIPDDGWKITDTIKIVINKNHLLSTLQGIGAIIIALVIFSAQEAFKDKNKYLSRSKWLIKESKLGVLLTAVILLFLVLLIGKSSLVLVFGIFLIAFLTVYSFLIVFRQRADSSIFGEKEIGALFEKTKSVIYKMVNYEYRKIIGRNKLRDFCQTYNNSIEMREIAIYFEGDINKYYEFNSKIKGRVVDINLDQLFDLLGNLDKDAKELRTKSFSEIEISDAPKEQEKLCYVSPIYYESVSKNNTLLWIRKDVLKDEEIVKVDKIFTIIKQVDDIEGDRIEIGKLKQCYQYFLEAGRSANIKKVCDFYIEMLNAHRDNIVRNKNSNDNSVKDNFNGFKTLTWICDDISDTMRNSIDNCDLKLVAETGKLGYAMMNYFIQSGDHARYKQYMSNILWYRYEAYKKAKKSGNIEFADFILDRSWRMPYEIHRFYLIPELEKDASQAPDDGKLLYLESINIFQKLLKASYDDLDIDAFQIYLREMVRLFKTVDRAYDYDNTTHNLSKYRLKADR